MKIYFEMTHFPEGDQPHDEPILTLKYIRDDHYKVSSIWQAPDIAEP